LYGHAARFACCTQARLDHRPLVSWLGGIRDGCIRSGTFWSRPLQRTLLAGRNAGNPAGIYCEWGMTMSTAIQQARRLFTVDEYDRMVRARVFGPDDRLELIDGEIVEMSPIGPRHAACVANLTRILVTQLGDRAVVWAQNPVAIPLRSKPQPDLALLRPRSYVDAHPGPEDVLLLIEVADTSLAWDRGVKLALYA
jgi:hypothetical protein